MKNLLLIIALLAAVAVKADSIVLTVTGGVSSNIFSVGKIIDTITVTATTTNITTLTFRDSSNTTTTYVAGAYTHYSGYATNITTVFTNEAHVIITNTIAGWYTGSTTVAAATNAIPAVFTMVVPASGTRVKDVHIQTMRGLNVVPSDAAIVEVDYRNNP